MRVPKSRQHFRYVYGYVSRPYSPRTNILYTSAQLKPTVFRDATPCRAYAIMRSKGESLSAGEVARYVGQYQEISGHICPIINGEAAHAASVGSMII